MYKKGIEMNLLFDHGKISRFSFNNIVGIAVRQNELLWAEGFILNYKDFLEPAHQTSTFSLNIARLAFAKQAYKEALFLLQKADYEDLINHMIAKILQLKIYYQLKEFDALDALIQSLRVFIQRKRRMGYHYWIWKNILQYMQKLRKVNPYDKTAIEALKEQIKTEKVLPEREWLLEQL